MHKLGTGLELWGGLFSFQVALSARKVIIPLFYHLAVLDYKPCYSQEPWLVGDQEYYKLNSPRISEGFAPPKENFLDHNIIVSMSLSQESACWH